ncbi:hypothetical protein BKA61DRAFT_718934 [Leptodontidium sp. MPI-SDFR-AT-0119]|nr:hypothetical protein BKA61DRAFT_718934 [Leptodontidium sp. MPI-SDFR-AT-0119]
MPTAKEDQKPSDPNVSYADRVTRSLEKVPIEVDSEGTQEESAHCSSHASKQSKQRRHSSDVRTASRQDQRESPSVSNHPLCFSDQISSLDLNLSIPNGSSISVTSQNLDADADLSSRFVQSDLLLAVSNWTDSFDISHPSFLNPPHDNARISSCLQHMPSGITNHAAYLGRESLPFDRWLKEVSGDGYDIALQLRHQDEPYCTCIVVQDGVGEDIDGPQELTWSK